MTLRSHLQKQEVLFIVRKMICFSNVIIVNMNQSLNNLIKFLDPTMYKEYALERFKDNKTDTKPEFDFKPSKLLKTKTFYDKTLDQLTRFDQLVTTHLNKHLYIKD